MNRRFFLMGSAAVVLSAGAANANCDEQAEECGELVPNTKFGAGTNGQPADYQIEVCLPNDVWHAIQPQDGSPAQWVFRLVTFDKRGTVRWHAAQKMVGQQCRTQGVYAGTHVFVYVTCDSYTGWLTTGPIRSSGKKSLQSIEWQMSYKQLDQRFPGGL